MDYKPDWDKWRNYADAECWQLVYLASDVDPDSRYKSPFDVYIPEPINRLLQNRLDIAENNVRKAGPLFPLSSGQPPVAARLSFHNFREWTQSLNPPWELPPEFPEHSPAITPSGPVKRGPKTGARDETQARLIVGLAKAAGYDFRRQKQGNGVTQKLADKTGLDPKTITKLLSEAYTMAGDIDITC